MSKRRFVWVVEYQVGNQWFTCNPPASFTFNNQQEADAAASIRQSKYQTTYRATKYIAVKP